LINQQAAMLSYNDLSWIFMLMFLFVTVFILFLPHSKSAGKDVEEEVVLVD